MRPAAFFTAAVFTLAAVAPAPGGVLDVELRSQAAPHWCWLASAEMVHDYQRCADAAKVGQCTLARTVLDDCECQPPDGYKVSDECNKPTTVTSGWVPSALGETQIAASRLTLGRAFSPTALTCQLETDRLPVIFWWLWASSCDQKGHLGLVVGSQQSAGEQLFATLDPAPVGEGDRGWHTWTGYACGPQGGRCTDYHGFARLESLEPLQCGVEQVRPNCGRGDHDSVRQALDRAQEWLNGPSAGGLFEHLQLPGPTAGGKVRCLDQLPITEAVPAPQTVIAKELRTTATSRDRYLCEVDPSTDTWISVQLFEATDGRFAVSGFGHPSFGRRLATALHQLVPGLDLKRQLAAPEAVRWQPGFEVEEVFLPGLGAWLLVVSGPEEEDLVGTIGFAKEAIEDRKSVLEIEVSPGWYLADWIGYWTR